MLMRQKDCSCGTHGNTARTAVKKNFPVLSAILLVILPKCPFCIMAYSSTIMLCGNNTVSIYQQHHQSPLTILLTSVCCLVIIAGLLLNFQGRRTKLALAVSLPGMMVIMSTVVFGGGQYLYYLGVLFIIAAVWLNGNGARLFEKIRTGFSVPAGARTNIV